MMSSSSWKRPKLNIPKTMGEKIGDGIGLTLYIGSILFLAYLWKDLPDKVPAHYNFAGEVDRWGSKWELWIFPGLMFESAAIAMGWWKGLGIWLLPIFIIGVGIPIVKMLLNQRKIK